ncbi:MAG: GNAT family N-acetyltransferase [Candidatus Promineofilum sp.]|nr:GNAT family N-acetyltransferase [Promineifilum sp.]
MITIRPARPEDAAQIITYARRVFAEPGVSLITLAEEFNPTTESEARMISEMNRATNSLFLVAEDDGRIVGQLTLQGGKRRNVRHAATLGITVGREHRGQGVGRRLMEYAIDWARAGGVVTRIELNVFVRNSNAIRLYESCGFVVEGRRRRSIHRDGEYMDDLVMALLLD